MMKKIILGIFTVGLLFLHGSFQKMSSMNEDLIGVWVYNGSGMFVKSEKFNPVKSGVEFKTDGKLVKRQNSGWCGTPPITFENVNGTWGLSSEAILTISYKYWGGKAEQDWKVLEVTPEKLLIKELDYRRITH